MNRQNLTIPGIPQPPLVLANVTQSCCTFMTKHAKIGSHRLSSGVSAQPSLKSWDHQTLQKIYNVWLEYLKLQPLQPWSVALLSAWQSWELAKPKIYVLCVCVCVCVCERERERERKPADIPGQILNIHHHIYQPYWLSSLDSSRVCHWKQEPR